MGHDHKNPKTLEPTKFAIDEKYVLGWTGEGASKSIYFEDGHVTAVHKKWFNCGWEGQPGWRCLFFGNTPLHVGDEIVNGEPSVRSEFLELTSTYHKNNYCMDGIWRGAREGLKSNKLVEIWYKGLGQNLLIHPSRGHFFPAKTDKEKGDLVKAARSGLKLAAKEQIKGKTKLNASSGSTKKRG